MTKTALALACAMPLIACASDLPMSCDMSVKSFFAPLVQGNLIATKPISVSENSLNEFRPKLLSHLTAYGMQVTSILGYADDPLLFVRKGDHPSYGYGVAVRESIANVQAQLSSMGATQAKTARVSTGITLIFCKGEPQ